LYHMYIYICVCVCVCVCGETIPYNNFKLKHP